MEGSGSQGPEKSKYPLGSPSDKMVYKGMTPQGGHEVRITDPANPKKGTIRTFTPTDIGYDVTEAPFKPRATQRLEAEAQKKAAEAVPDTGTRHFAAGGSPVIEVLTDAEMAARKQQGPVRKFLNFLTGK